jgi:biopolymer transport protein ExbD
VAVNLSGQLFFENQLILEQPLRQRLVEAVQRARGPLSLVLQADREIPYETILRLGALARGAGLTEILLATRPQTGRTPRPAEPVPGGNL